MRTETKILLLLHSEFCVFVLMNMCFVFMLPFLNFFCISVKI